MPCKPNDVAKGSTSLVFRLYNQINDNFLNCKKFKTFNTVCVYAFFTQNVNATFPF